MEQNSRKPRVRNANWVIGQAKIVENRKFCDGKIEQVWGGIWKTLANFPKQTDKKIIMAVWCKNNKIKNGEYRIGSPGDVLSGLK